jgi:hypothetical protein
MSHVHASGAAPPHRARLAFVALALGTIAMGLAVRWHGQGLPPVARDVLGDALWATMLAWWVGAAMPGVALWRRGALTMTLCIAVELGQLYRAPTLDALRRTPVGRLVLGTDFDTRDLGAYALGVLVAALLEAAVRRRTATPRR